MTFTLQTYEVWGNQVDGYDVNNVFTVNRNVEIDENSIDDDEKIIKALVNIHYLTEEATTETIGIVWTSDERAEIESRITGEPYGCLRLNTTY